MTFPVRGRLGKQDLFASQSLTYFYRIYSGFSSDETDLYFFVGWIAQNHETGSERLKWMKAIWQDA
jgi:hypothetical protein